MAFTLEIQHCLAICILTTRDGQTRNSFGDRKFNLFSVAVHEIGHCIGLFHNTEDKDGIMRPIYQPGFSVENKNNIHSESDIKTVREMYGAAKHVIVTAIFNSNKAKFIIKNIKKDSDKKG